MPSFKFVPVFVVAGLSVKSIIPATLFLFILPRRGQENALLESVYRILFGAGSEGYC